MNEMQTPVMPAPVANPRRKFGEAMRGNRDGLIKLAKFLGVTTVIGAVIVGIGNLTNNDVVMQFGGIFLAPAAFTIGLAFVAFGFWLFFWPTVILFRKGRTFWGLSSIFWFLFQPLWWIVAIAAKDKQAIAVQQYQIAQAQHAQAQMQTAQLAQMTELLARQNQALPPQS
jgi:hypothetical protein